ncbi:hypothetical protein LINPERHAP1_LOCUS34576, partial [Linum perenne]
QARTCIIQPSLDDVLQCTDHGRGFVVDLRRHICSCGYWQLSGVPCVHGVAAISYMRYDVTEYVEKYYTVHLAKKAYTKGVPPLPGREDWVDVEGLPVLPPPQKVMPGRPKKNRRKEPGEVSTRPSRTGVGKMMRKTGAVMHCSRCGHTDHNVRGCKMTDEEVAAIPPPPPPRPVGRPRRTPIEEQQQGEANDQVFRRHFLVFHVGTKIVYVPHLAFLYLRSDSLHVGGKSGASIVSTLVTISGVAQLEEGFNQVPLGETHHDPSSSVR